MPDPQYLFSPDDPFGWKVSEFEEALELQTGPGTDRPASARHSSERLLDGNPDTGLPRSHSAEQSVLAARTGRRAKLQHERCVAPAAAGPVAHPGRQGPRALDALRQQRAGAGQGVLEELLHGPGIEERRPKRASAFFCRLLQAVYGEKVADGRRLRRAGFRILPDDEAADFPFWDEGQLPSWAKPFLLPDERAAHGREIPADVPPVRPAARGGARRRTWRAQLHLLPFPGEPGLLGRPSVPASYIASCRWHCRSRCWPT